jgi:hypothetical protein
MIDAVKKAKESGYSDQEIFDYLKTNPKYTEKFIKAKESGYSDQEISNHLFGNTSIPQTQKIPSFENENDLDREIERNEARLTSRTIETIAGLPGDLLSFVAHISGEKPILPTSGDIQKKTEKLSKGYLSPKNELEKTSDKLIKDIASFSIGPGAGFTKNLGIPLAGTAVEESLKGLGASDETASYSKMGTMLMLDLARIRRSAGGSAKDFASNLFSKAEKSIPEGTKIKVPDLEDALMKLESEFQSGGGRPSVKSALEKIHEIRSQIKDNQISAKWLLDNRQAINEVIKEGGGFGVILPKDIKQKIHINLNKVKKNSIDALIDYGKKENPEFLKYYEPANEAYAVNQKADAISNFLQKHFGNYLTNSVAKSLFGGAGAIGAGVLGGAKALGITAATAGTAFPLYQAGKLLYKVVNSPTLRKYYSQIIEGATKGNVSEVAQNLQKLEKGLKQD